jgi:hypothetical protein
MRKLAVNRLGDEFGDYLLTIACRQCRHIRVVEPRARVHRGLGNHLIRPRKWPEAFGNNQPLDLARQWVSFGICGSAG